MNVKGSHAGFPKAAIKEKLKERGDVVHMELAYEHECMTGKQIFGSGHMDLQPMALVHTCTTSQPG